MQTLEGKKAGLQNATALREENEQIRRREDDMFRRMAEKQKSDGMIPFFLISKFFRFVSFRFLFIHE